jgi:hypothetical protein
MWWDVLLWFACLLSVGAGGVMFVWLGVDHVFLLAFLVHTLLSIYDFDSGEVLPYFAAPTTDEVSLFIDS